MPNPGSTIKVGVYIGVEFLFVSFKSSVGAFLSVSFYLFLFICRYHFFPNF